MGEIDDDRYFPRYRRGDPIRRMATENVTCKFCGADGLRWQKFRGEYRLLNSDLSARQVSKGLRT